MDEFSDAVLDCVDRIPSGRVTTYGLIADHLATRGYRGGPRRVGWVMARVGESVTWWRVVRANGSLPPHLMLEAQKAWADERTPVRRGRVDIEAAVWHFGDPTAG